MSFQDYRARTQDRQKVKGKIFYFLLFTFFFAMAGCQAPDREKKLLVQIDQLTGQNKQLAGRIEQSRTESTQLQKQVQVLSGLPPQVKAENLYTIQSVQLGRYTGLADENNDGKPDTLLVYIQPIDQQGDIIKAGGAADIQLWDLNKTADNALLGSWHVGPQELKKLWIQFVVTNYRLKFDVSKIIENLNVPLTVKMSFTDYLTGRVFEEQRVIKPLK
jgi:hypothetical protein